LLWCIICDDHVDWPRSSPSQDQAARKRFVIEIRFDRFASGQHLSDIPVTDLALEHALQSMNTKDQPSSLQILGLTSCEKHGLPTKTHREDDKPAGAVILQRYTGDISKGDACDHAHLSVAGNLARFGLRVNHVSDNVKRRRERFQREGRRG